MLRIALAQLAAGPDRAANLARVLDVMGEAQRAGAGLIAFPEIILDRFFPESRDNREAAFQLAEPIPGPTSDRIAARARELGLVTVFNLYEVDASGRRFDSSPVFDANGRAFPNVRVSGIGNERGLDIGWRAELTLNAPVDDVTLTLVTFGDAVEAMTAR